MVWVQHTIFLYVVCMLVCLKMTLILKGLKKNRTLFRNTLI